MKKRIALAGIYHESNTFLPTKTTREDFQNGHLFYDQAIREEYQEAHHEIGGILEVFDKSNVDIYPLFFAEATPGGMITKDTYLQLVSDLLSKLQEYGPWDGVMVCAHGAAVAEEYPDMDGDWLSQVRQQVGGQVPVVCTIDPHANVSTRMINATDAMVAYSTNPHLDQRETGRKAARLMLDHLSGRVVLTQILSKPRVSISIEQQATAEYPCSLLYAQAAEFLKLTGLLSISIVLGFPYSDVAKMGSAFIVVADDQRGEADHAAKSMGIYLEENRHLFVGERIDAQAAVEKAMEMESPVLLLDMGDNVGGGSPGDGTILLQELENHGGQSYFICLFDPMAVEVSDGAGEGADIRLTVGGETDELHGSPCTLKVSVVKLADGVFIENEPRHGGQVNYNMGRIAIVETADGSTLMLTSRRIPPFSLSQLTTFGVDPQNYDVIVAKGVNAPVAAYAPVCPSLIRVNTPGVTCADATQLEFKNRRKPLFPFEDWSL
ncbi:M81 family metallopeptidase [Membranicola marinus]|uniref:M81 family metallopeptidase n=1 Tax=Membranihabitans marinus TaxID=1227546 RepID=A0A953L9S8_9BACT|nr:M81 family metallopeptidase [Membranihabitans marinus]MBY5956951.1 M81 family metallopeptidase [Membranihabitans marinus]